MSRRKERDKLTLMRIIYQKKENETMRFVVCLNRARRAKKIRCYLFVVSIRCSSDHAKNKKIRSITTQNSSIDQTANYYRDFNHVSTTLCEYNDWWNSKSTEIKIIVGFDDWVFLHSDCRFVFAEIIHSRRKYVEWWVIVHSVSSSFYRWVVEFL